MMMSIEKAMEGEMEKRTVQAFSKLPIDIINRPPGGISMPELIAHLEYAADNGTQHFIIDNLQFLSNINRYFWRKFYHLEVHDIDRNFHFEI